MTAAWIAGATGLVGRALRAELPDAIALARKPQPGLAVVDYTRPESFAALPAPQRLFIALGTTMAQAGSQAAFRAADFDAVVAVARAARERGATRCGLVSALSADARSGVFYNRVKGEAEDALIALGFERLVIARPSLLDGERAGLAQPSRAGEGWALRLSRPVAGLIPARWRPITPERVARALALALAQDGPALQVLESGTMQTLGAP
ncbi:NAD(P)H-binding protein [Roseateles sp. P5_E7]